MSTASWMRRGRPRSLSASIAARTVRPLNSTSSTSTTVLAVTSKGTCVGWTWRREAAVEIVAVHGDIEVAGRNGVAPDAGEQRAETPGKENAAALDADDRHLRAGVVALGDLVRDAGERALDGGGVEDEGGFRHKKSEPAVGRFAGGWGVGVSWRPWQPRGIAIKGGGPVNWIYSARSGGFSAIWNGVSKSSP